MKYIARNLGSVVMQASAEYPVVLVTGSRQVGKAMTPRAKGAILCMKPELSAIDRENHIVPVWMI